MTGIATRLNQGPWPRWAGNLLLFVLVIQFALWLARLTWIMAWTPSPLPGFDGGENAAIAQGGGTSLAAFHLFGRPPAGQAVSETVSERAPETNLQLRLEGVLMAGDREQSGAIVSGGSEPASWYRIGDTLPGNAELVEVESRRILIRRSGEVETLTFEEPESEGMVTESEGPEVDLSSPEAFVTDARQQLEEQGAAALARFGLRPVSSGAASGYVFDGSNPMLSSLNLQEGDVVTAINGHRLGDPGQDAELLEQWKNAGQITVQVQRDGSQFTVNYALPN